MLVKTGVREMLGCRTFSLGIGLLIDGVIDVEDITLLSLEWNLEVRLAQLGVAGRCSTLATVGGKRKTVFSSLAEFWLDLASNIFGSICMGHSGELGTKLASANSFFLLRRWYNKPKAMSVKKSRNPTMPPTAPIIGPVDKNVLDLKKWVMRKNIVTKHTLVVGCHRWLKLGFGIFQL